MKQSCIVSIAVRGSVAIGWVQRYATNAGHFFVAEGIDVIWGFGYIGRLVPGRLAQLVRALP